MRTLTLLATLLLLALQAQAQTLQETADQVPAQEQPTAKDIWAEDQDQAEDDDQDVAISFTGEERLTRAVGLWKLRRCTCRLNRFCKSFESPSGTCYIYGQRYKRCCR
ncbi:alpha-defensin 1-like [Myotis daubentonii]|uniref:alpha-defensin 1-like n=1 Tax=Myotis daubentonii TaxID=98922 RepID=UPI002872AFBD|nr:alpha-defensin 1-like [Myotis daubentonii]